MSQDNAIIYEHVKLFYMIIIDREALAKQGDNALGSVRPSVRPSVRLSVRLCVCLSALSRLNRLTFDLDFWYGCRP